MGQGPEELRAEIERTRQDLGRDADALADKVDPRKAVKRRVEGARETTRDVTGRLRERVMGVAESAKDKVPGSGSSGSGVGDSASSAVSQIGDTGGQVMGKVRSSTEGSPLAAAAVAFAAGWFVASLIPASEKERTLAGKAVGAAASGGGSSDGGSGGGQAKQALTDIVEGMKEPVTEAAKSVGSTAQEAAKSTAGASVDTAKSSGRTS